MNLHGTKRLWTRDTSDTHNSFAMIAAGVTGGIVILIGITYVLFVRAQRRSKRYRTKVAEGESAFEPVRNNENVEAGHGIPLQSSQSGGNASTNTSTQASSTTAARATTNSGAAVDRHASVRSIMTLPAYRPTANTNEQVLGREGDRSGVDIIVDLPDEEHHESLRDEEMAALYEVRELRRQYAAGEQTRRAEQEDAIRRSDVSTLLESRARSRSSAENTNGRIDELRVQIAEARDQRHRSVSSVSYGDLGVARHDGSRIRASSNDSERMGLLSDAASIGTASHRRGRSVSSVGSVDSRSQSPVNRPRSSEPIVGSSPELIEGDLGSESHPPPQYEETPSRGESPAFISATQSPHDSPPDYSSPVEERNPARDAGLNISLPEIRIEPEINLDRSSSNARR